jgi:hypothetical protein
VSELISPLVIVVNEVPKRSCPAFSEIFQNGKVIFFTASQSESWARSINIKTVDVIESADRV